MKNRMDIDHHKQRILIGSVALIFPVICIMLFWLSIGKVVQPTSISVTYHLGTRDVFCGLLFVVSAFLFAYRGWSAFEDKLSSLASACAITVALAPTSINLNWLDSFSIDFNEEQCLLGRALEDRICITSAYDYVPYLHQGAAVLLIFILFIFCWGFYKRASDKFKMHPNKVAVLRRKRIYFLAMIAMPLSVAWAVMVYLVKGDIVGDPSLFYVEWVCLWAFAISWLVASKQIPLLSQSSQEENEMDVQLHLLRH